MREAHQEVQTEALATIHRSTAIRQQVAGMEEKAVALVVRLVEPVAAVAAVAFKRKPAAAGTLHQLLQRKALMVPRL